MLMYPHLKVWDWDRTSRNDFMGALSFGMSEVLRSQVPVRGWFKLLTQVSHIIPPLFWTFGFQEEGEFYNVPVLAEGEEISDDLQMLRLQPDSVKERSVVRPFDNIRIHIYICIRSSSQKDSRSIQCEAAIGLEEFNFLMVLGKGSFGKAREMKYLSPKIPICFQRQGVACRKKGLGWTICCKNSKERHHYPSKTTISDLVIINNKNFW